MTARQVTAELKRQFWPMVIDLGFVMKGTRNAKRIRGPVTAFVTVPTLTTRGQELRHAPPGSFEAAVGLDLIGAEPASFYENPYDIPDVGTTALRLYLVRSVQSATHAQTDVWSLDDFDAADAVEDLCRQFACDGIPFLELWQDPVSAYRQLAGIDESPWPDLFDGTHVGGASIDWPGRPGSILRLRHLAVAAARLGNIEAERQHLEDLLGHLEDPRVRTRLDELNRLA